MVGRVRAFLLHMGSSTFIALLAMFLVFKLWYPVPLHMAVGVTHIFLLLLVVDVLLGPLLTLVVYKQGKKSLKFDLAVIIALQLSALFYGLWVVAEGRPAWLVFNADRFDLVRVLEIDTRGLDEVTAAYREAPWLGPQWVGAALPDDVEQRNAITLESVMAGLDVAQRPVLYRPLTNMADALRQRARPLDELQRYNNAEQVALVLKKWPEATAWLPLMATVKPMVVLLDMQAAEVVAVVDLAPWD